mgnify:FL=1
MLKTVDLWNLRFPNISDNAEIVEMIAFAALLVLFTTDRGSVVGSAISSVIKISVNPERYYNLSEDIDLNTGLIIEGKATVVEVEQTIFEQMINVISGNMGKSE